jgi:ribosomal protein S14
MLINTNKLANIPLDNLSPMCPSRHTMSAFGSSGYIPTEIICTILENTDLLSIMHLRATSMTWRDIINDWEPFHEILTGAPDVLRALLATKAAAMFTAPQISNAVFTTRCEFCGECGNFLQLLKLARCCFRCLANDRRLFSVPISYAKRKMGLDPGLLPRIPHLKTISRAKFWGMHKNMSSYCAIDYNAALELARPYLVRTTGSELEPYLHELPTIIRRRRQKAHSVHQRHVGVSKPFRQGPPARPLSSYPITTIRPLANDVDINPPEDEVFRFLSAMHAPGRLKTTSFDPQTNTSAVHQTVEQHGYCKGCRFYWNLCSPHLPIEHTIYNLEEISSHIQTCFYAHLLWGRLYPGGRVDHVHSVMMLKQYPPLFKLRHPVEVQGSFEQIPDEAMFAYEMSHPQDNGYGELLLGSQDPDSQATWATSHKSAYGALRRSISSMMLRKSNQGVDIGPWKRASQMLFRRPNTIRGPPCIKGLPTTSLLHPEHGYLLYHNDQQINLWFEQETNIWYPEPWFLETLGQ